MDKIEHAAHLITLLSLAVGADIQDILACLEGSVLSEEECGDIRSLAKSEHH